MPGRRCRRGGATRSRTVPGSVVYCRTLSPRGVRIMHARAPHALRAGRPAAALLSLLVATAGATTGATFRSGVGDRFLERPPFYAGADLSPGGGLPAAHFPIAWQRGSTQPAMFEPKADGDTPVAALLAEMNAYLDSLGVTTRIAVSGNPSGTPPDVMFGCQR